MARCLIPLIGLLWLTGCAVTAPTTAPDPSLACGSYLKTLNRRIERAGLRDAEAAIVLNRPWLRVDRFLADFTPAALSPAERRDWLEQAFVRGQQALALEARNLGGDAAGEKALRCGAERFRAERADLESAVAALAPRVPDSYSTANRILGLYPLSAWVARPSINAYRADKRARYERGLAPDAPVMLYRPPSSLSVAITASTGSLIERARRRSPLGVPRFQPEEAEALLTRFAPALRVETRQTADRVGTVQRDADGPFVAGPPVAYTYLSETRVGNAVWPQLNYVFWFPARPPQQPGDIYAGRLDGLVWRVTLNTEGEVMWYDSIHPCGCYHMLYLVNDDWRPREAIAGERPVIIPTAPDAGSRRLQITLSAGEHYVIGLQRDGTRNGEAVPYALAGYNALRSLPVRGREDRYRSLFNEQGLVPESARPERWRLWPLGIPSAGAMRQRGTQATAFIGRRHFDDPRLFEQLLQRREANNDVP